MYRSLAHYFSDCAWQRSVCLKISHKGVCVKKGLFNKLFTIALLIGCFYLPKNSWANDEKPVAPPKKVNMSMPALYERANQECGGSLINNSQQCIKSKEDCIDKYRKYLYEHCDHFTGYDNGYFNADFYACDETDFDAAKQFYSLPLSQAASDCSLLNQNPNQFPSCGDKVIASNEACDDGGIINGDGCSATCTVEPGYMCKDEPSVCVKGELSTFQPVPPTPPEDPQDKSSTTPNDEVETGTNPAKGSFLEGGCSLNPGSTKASVREYFLLTLFGLPLVGVYIQKRKPSKS